MYVTYPSMYMYVIFDKFVDFHEIWYGEYVIKEQAEILL
jgi:hypothetical protein